MIICMIAATACFLVFCFLFMTANDSILGAMINCMKETQVETIKSTQIEMKLLVEEMQKTNDLTDKQKIAQGKKLKKKLDEAQKLLDSLNKNKLSALDMIPLAGYRLMQLMNWDSTNDLIKKMNQKCVQFKEKKEAINYTYYLLASLFGNLILGVTAFLAALGFAVGMGMGTRSIIVAVVAFAVFALMGYLPYDSVNSIVNKRAEEIEREFPQVVSKLALLTVAGMEVNQAWKLASKSGHGTLYTEMNRVNIDFDNNVPPVEAYSKFITRCNNNYTTKLATAIIQNMSKGNSEIVELFKSLNSESWMEHKHNARRMGEKIQSKLMIPTMLMFLGIIILIIVPVMSGFNF